MEGLLASDDAWLFLEPVPRDVPLYYEIIAHPTDLGTISRRLRSGDFCDASRVFLEVQQVSALAPGVHLPQISTQAAILLCCRPQHKAAADVFLWKGDQNFNRSLLSGQNQGVCSGVKLRNQPSVPPN